MNLRRILIVGALLVAVLAVLFSDSFALFMEGYPKPVWPMSGNYSEQGSFAALEHAQVSSKEPPETLLTLFEESSGSAILAARRGEIEFEHYAKGYSSETEFNSFSLVKSLIGGASPQGCCRGQGIQLG